MSPAFMRPRTSLHLLRDMTSSEIELLAYGEYNDQVVEVARQYGQSVVIWDFEYLPH